jgi:hypothetical protein
MEFGQLIRSSQISGASFDLLPAASPGDWKGQPGTRAPHAWIMKGDVRISTLDLFGRDFVLLIAKGAWREGVKSLGLKVIQVETDIVFSEETTFADMFGVGAEGAVLVRPDGIVAWRAESMSSPNDFDELRRLVSGGTNESPI